LIVNPHEIHAVAAAMKRALEMPLDEWCERHVPMVAHLLKNDIKRWARSYTWIVNPRGIVADEPAISEAANRVRMLRLGDNKALNGQRLR
jgi:hypothetical protein